MQVLWSRTARTTSCRCTTCLHSATTTLARRTTTAAPRRRAKFGDVFTAFYSAIFATAALADAKIKGDRRKQWDQAIAEAKAGYDGTSPDPKVLEGQGTTISNLPEGSPYEAKSFSRYERMIRGLTPIQQSLNSVDSLSSLKVQTTPLEKKLKLLDSHLRQSFLPRGINADGADELGIYHDDDAYGGKHNWGNELLETGRERQRLSKTVSPDELGSQNLLDYRSDASVSSRREPKSTVNLVMMEKMVAELVTQLLLNTKAFSMKNGSDNSIVSDDLATHENAGQETLDDSIPESRTISERWETLRHGRMGRTRLPSYTGVRHSSEWTQERAALHNSMESILSPKGSKPKLTDLLVAKICYNLLVSTAPPTIDTYNLMIEHFTKLRDHASAQIVIFSFFNRSKLRANERTVIAVLEHYAITKDSKGFRETIHRMRGAGGDFRLKRHHQNDLNMPRVQNWALTHKVNLRGGYLHEKVQRTSKIFETLIYGAWERFSLSNALVYYKASVIEGRPVSGSLFVDLVKGCLSHHVASDWLSLKLLRNFLCHWRHDSYSLNSITSDPIARKYLYKLMRKAGIDPPHKLQEVGWLPEPTHWLHTRAFRDCFSDMMRQMYIERLEAMMDASVKLLSKLKAAVDHSNTTLTTMQEPIKLNGHYLAELPGVEESSRSVFDALGVEVEQRIDELVLTLASLGTKIAFNRLDPSINYIEDLKDHHVSPKFVTTVTETPQGKRFASSVTIDGHPESFGITSDLFTSEMISKQYASICAIDWLSTRPLATSIRQVDLSSYKVERATKTPTISELYDRLTRGLRGVSEAKLEERISSSKALSRTSSGLHLGSEATLFVVPTVDKLAQSRELAVGGSFTPLSTAAVDPATRITRSAPMDPSSRLQQPARRFQVIEYRPKITEYPMIFDEPTPAYAKAEN